MAEAEVEQDEMMLKETDIKLTNLSPSQLRKSEMEIISTLSKQYIAVAIVCFVLLSLSQVISVVTLSLSTIGPVAVTATLLLLFNTVYWTKFNNTQRGTDEAIWLSPYPYSAVGSVLGCLSQHALLLEEKQLNYAKYVFILFFYSFSLFVSFILIESFYLILVAAAYKNFISGWKKKLKFRRLCYSVYLDKLAPS